MVDNPEALERNIENV
jgi:hypothetical protein